MGDAKHSGVIDLSEGESLYLSLEPGARTTRVSVAPFGFGAVACGLALLLLWDGVWWLCGILLLLGVALLGSSVSRVGLTQTVMMGRERFEVQGAFAEAEGSLSSIEDLSLDLKETPCLWLVTAEGRYALGEGLGEDELRGLLQRLSAHLDAVR